MLSVTGKKMSALMREIYDEFGTAYMTERDWPSMRKRSSG